MSGADLTLIQLTDTHICRAGDKVHGAVDALDNLCAALDLLIASGQRIDALVLSGDLTDRGDPEAYRRLREVVAPAAEELGAEVIYAMGNHDDRAAFVSVLIGSSDSSRPVDVGAPVDAVFEIRGVRIVVLDSTTAGRHDGRLEPSQLSWLSEVLARPCPGGSILVLHHPPIPSPVVSVDSLRLQECERLEAVLLGSDVQMILCGHAHHTGAGSIAGIPVWVGPAMSYRVDPIPPFGRHRGVVGFGFTRVDKFGSSVVATAVEATPSSTVYDESIQDILDKLAALAIQAG
ncbi:metallophosphoesterase [Rhodococcus erythropolis]|uniref:Metallophosphoesterase n=1 Tax=Rhodococcus erythropolis TaxID=1833 RepID=A0AAX3ZXW8_RHOER|nr:metallophosphoesterase [Rhodococcus erythropolis]WMN01912.1 metallophosphoesterase [Rhodococcus erythropolis]WMN03198.1 metallophosphoesterase [Rhodococcus erythropolis]